MRRVSFLNITAILLLATTCLFAQSKVTNILVENLVRLDSNQQVGYTMPMDLFKSAISGNKILALGEATHGTKNFVDFRLFLIKKLVGDYGYKAIVTESDFSSTLAMNDYIVFGRGNLRKSLQDMGYWMWNNPDFLQTIEWLRAYNASRDLKNRVRIYGCDMTVPLIIGDIVSGAQALKKPLSAESIDALKLLRTWTTKSIPKHEELLLNKLGQEINAEILLYNDTSVLKNSLNTILQVISFRLIGSGKDQSAFRDKSMSENIKWIYNHENEGKLIFLAHNLHIAKSPMIGGWENVGTRLSRTYGSSYYALGFCFYRGTFRAQDRASGKSHLFNIEQADKKSVELTFKESNIPNFYLDFSSIKENSLLDELLFKRRTVRSIGAAFSNSKRDDLATSIDAVLYKVFDGIVFFDKTYPLAPSFGWNNYKM